MYQIVSYVVSLVTLLMNVIRKNAIMKYWLHIIINKPGIVVNAHGRCATWTDKLYCLLL